MSATPSPSGWVIPNGDTQDFSFTSTFNGVNSLSDQALTMSASASPRPVILPDNSPGNISETRVECSVMANNPAERTIGIVFAYQDINNYLAVETNLKGYNTGEVQNIRLSEKVSGSVNRLTLSGPILSGLNPTAGWVDLRFQVFRPSSSEVSFRISAAEHGNSYQVITTVTREDSTLPFTSGDVGLTAAHDVQDPSKVAFDGDPVGSGGRPIKMYWA